ncbi:flavin-dependent dehydrogenase [Nonomuraea thailandensis]|uniref:Flavin-dependent dehydrogenase n=1 Tax=Nonomuraea thailandensis TaxID=1188745 RepID=A0A9X2K1V7_9ACTN|nr:FAD-dependent monooxygenase [Nonomuraea thailandensis]MCP2357368.1 flavin-dependent dehydrogenase [Nonomuraea thailandensis]
MGDEHAIVVGAGFAGLLAARVLADHYRAVTLLEKDPVTADVVRRPGLPQARHVHVLLDRGMRGLEALFPGLAEELAGTGAATFDVCRMAAMLPRGWAPDVPLGLALTSPDRGVLDRVLRRRVLALPGVRLERGFHVERLRFTSERGKPRCVGVSGHASRDVDADLVVDASGRHSRLPHWLTAAGLPTPPERVLPGRACYTSRLYQPPAGSSWRPAVELTSAPLVPRGAAVVPVEPDRWLVSLTGMNQQAPFDEAGFLRYARSLRNPEISRVIAEGRPLSRIHGYAVRPNRWRLHHRTASAWAGLLAFGDALFCLNPVYGQGMTVITMQALLLRDLLAEGRDPDTFAVRAPRLLAVPWLMTTAADIGWAPARRRSPSRLAARALNRLLDHAPHDPAVYRSLFSVIHLAASPATLLHPRVLAHLGRSAPVEGVVP